MIQIYRASHNGQFHVCGKIVRLDAYIYVYICLESHIPSEEVKLNEWVFKIHFY